jgi:dienelactone hydrolase
MHIVRSFAAAALVAFVASSPARAGAMTVSVVPVSSMTDTAVAVKISAPPGDTVDVALAAQKYGLTFRSSATYRAPASGVIDLSKQAPLHGSYAGVDPMGLLWTVFPDQTPPKPFAFGRDSDLRAVPFTITAVDGSKTATASGTRVTLSSDVERRVVDRGPFVATMFSQKRGGCERGVVILGGSEGGVPEQLAAVVASHGFTTLALGYFGAPGLPQTLTDIPIETVQRAVTFMHSRHEVCPSRSIAILGGSKGAELAVLAASTFSGIGPVVATAPSSIVFSGIGENGSDPDPSSWSYRGERWPFANGKVPPAVAKALDAQMKAGQKPSFLNTYLAQLDRNTEAGAPITVERIDAPVMVVAGGSDRLWPSARMARQIAARLKAHAHPFADEIEIYPRAGHPIGLPYQFAKAELAHAGIELGGTATSNEKADEASWPLILRFLQTSSWR